MKKLILVCTLFTALVGFSQSRSVLPEAFYHCWTASYEENKEGSTEKIYRPCEHEFPASRFRQSLKFEKNGTCQVLQLDAADAHYFVECKWTYLKKKKIVSIEGVNGKSIVKMKFILVAVDEEIMKIILIE